MAAFDEMMRQELACLMAVHIHGGNLQVRRVQRAEDDRRHTQLRQVTVDLKGAAHRDHARELPGGPGAVDQLLKIRHRIGLRHEGKLHIDPRDRTADARNKRLVGPVATPQVPAGEQDLEGLDLGLPGRLDAGADEGAGSLAGDEDPPLDELPHGLARGRLADAQGAAYLLGGQVTVADRESTLADITQKAFDQDEDMR